MFDPLYLLIFLPTWLAGVFLMLRLRRWREEERPVPAAAEIRREE